FAGTWTGTLNCTRTQTAGGSGGNPVAETLDFTITFGDDGAPTGVLILNYSDGQDAMAQISRDGDSATVTAAASVVTTTLEVEVTSASFTSSTIELRIAIDYSASGDTLTQSGTGTQTLTAILSGDAIEMTLSASYDVTQTLGTIEIETTETTDCTGTLTRQ
ncbi:MAG: hypothetical protein D6744_07360, partial [Planctomycetota bacterium]